MPIRMLILGLTGQCNFACVYCYADHHPQPRMSFETARQAIDMAAAGGEKFVVQLSGGEPLLAFDLIEEIRVQSHSVPVIFMSARDKEFDRIIGLEKGSDDYITKPFSPKELVLRVNNIIRRVYKDDNRTHVDSYEIDVEQRKVYKDNQEIELTTKEFDLLMLFVRNKQTAFSRGQILARVWETNYFGSDRVVDDTLRRLRKKMKDLNIHTIYGYGYRLG